MYLLNNMYDYELYHFVLMVNKGSSDILLNLASPPLIVSRVIETASLLMGPS